MPIDLRKDKQAREARATMAGVGAYFRGQPEEACPYASPQRGGQSGVEVAWREGWRFARDQAMQAERARPQRIEGLAKELARLLWQVQEDSDRVHDEAWRARALLELRSVKHEIPDAPIPEVDL